MKLITIILISTLWACGATKDLDKHSNEPYDDNQDVEIVEENKGWKVENSKTLEEPYNIKITITHSSSYCGGMAPSQEMLDQLNQLQKNTSFILVDLNSNEKLKVKTDTNGVLKLNLPIGKYAIKEIYKDCTLDQFKSQNPLTEGLYYTQSLDPDCYKKWWASYLGEFEINESSTATQTFYWGTSDACFTGNNPCIIYTGPYPP